MTTINPPGRTAIVTGASRGFGRAIAVGLAGDRCARRRRRPRRGLRSRTCSASSGHPSPPVVADVTDDGLAARTDRRAPAEHRGAQRRCDAACGDDPGSDLGDVQRELERRRAPRLRVRPSCVARSARPGLGGRQRVERSCAAGLADERRLRRSEGDRQVHQRLRRCRVGTAVVGHPLRVTAPEADARHRAGRDVRRFLRGLRPHRSRATFRHRLGPTLTAEQVADAVIHVADPTAPQRRLPTWSPLRD